MFQARLGDTVKIHFSYKFENNSIYYSSLGQKPLEFTIGRNQVIPRIEYAVIGMNEGESQSIEIPASEILGPFDDKASRTADREQIARKRMVIDLHLLEITYLNPLRTYILNYLIKNCDFKSYLEIGVENPERNFRLITCENKTGVDPNPAACADYVMTSDEFFKSYCRNRTFDLIFIDGLHLEKQAKQDITNSLQHLNTNGIIVVHDCNPMKETTQYEYQAEYKWNGTVWKAFAELRMTRPDLQMQCVDCDHGCGIIKVGRQEVYAKATLEQAKEYSFLERHRKELLNLITLEQFEKIYAQI